MKQWSEWEIVRRQVAICGRLKDAANGTIADGTVSLVSMPLALEVKLAGRDRESHDDGEKALGQMDRAISDPDGVYFFLDLPAGRYTLRAAKPKEDAGLEKSVDVEWKADGTVIRVTADFTFSQ